MSPVPSYVLRPLSDRIQDALRFRRPLVRLQQAIDRPMPEEGLDFNSLVQEVEIALILKASLHCHWNQSETARVLNIKRDQLRYRMRKYRLRGPRRPRRGRPCSEPVSP